MRQRQVFHRIGLAFVLAVTWFIVLLRIQPWPFSDYGVFLSVARRLNAGDVLYAEIWDNKDPFVYYSIALLQNLGQPGLWALEALWFLIASFSIFAISRTYGISRTWAIFGAGVFTPIVLIPFHYFPGTTHIPGISLTLAALAFYIAGRYALTGLALGFLFFFKLSMLPIALAGLAVLVLRRKSFASLRPMGVALIGSLIAASALLAVRGEFFPYLRSLVHNFTYSQTNTDTGEAGPLAVLSERLTVLSDIHVLITLITIAVIVLGTISQRRQYEIWDVAAGTYLVAVVLIVAIGKFPHHAQVLGVSAALSFVVLALAFSHFRQVQPLISSVLLFAVALALTGLPSVKGYRDALRNPQGTWQAMTTTDPSTQDLLDSGPPRTFAILQGGGLPRSPGLEEWELACRHIAQRPWESDELLSESLECFPSADVLLIPQGFSPASEPAEYRNFTESVSSLLRRDYICSDFTSATVCAKRPE